MKVIIVGGVAGGASAATRLRRNCEEAEIVLLERGPEVSFANCGLPYYIGGVIEERQSLLVTTPDKLRERFGLDVRTLTLVESLDLANKSVQLRHLPSQRSYSESFDKLLLATGAQPMRTQPELPEGFFELRSLEDADRIRAAALRAGTALVLGAGFIGLEMVENLVHLGLNVSLVEFQKQLLPALDPEMTVPMLEDLEKRGVQFYLGQAVQEMLPGPKVRLDSGQELSADLVIVGLGVRPENQLAQQAGLALGARGGIRVNAQMQTSHPDVYAVGDAVETTHVVSGAPVQIPLAGPANRQGRLAADAMCQKAVSYRGSQGTAIVGVFDWTAASTGLTEKQLRASAQDYRCIYLHPNHHAGYYPGAQGMSLKLLFEPALGKILGAQAIGGAGVDKRIDLFALAIQAGMTVFDLEQAELCYAPPYGSAKEPLNMAAFIAANSLRGDHPVLHQVSPEHVVIDVRTPAEFAQGHVPEALNIPLDELRSRLAEIPGQRPLLVYCQVGLRGYLATRILMQKGYAVANLSGGYRTYRSRQRAAL